SVSLLLCWAIHGVILTVKRCVRDIFSRCLLCPLPAPSPHPPPHHSSLSCVCRLLGTWLPRKAADACAAFSSARDYSGGFALRGSHSEFTPDDPIAEWEAENPRRRAQGSETPRRQAQLRELRARLAKDRHNSSRPPASDPLGRKRPRSQR